VLGADGFHHPASEDELVELVKRASREGRLLRVRGAAHSIAHAIYTESGIPNRVSQQEPPRGDGIDVMLDRYRDWQVVDAGERLVEAQAGINLASNPSDPSGTSTGDNGLLPGLARRGWTLYDTGGITHQTVSGFTATASSGGSVQHTSDSNLHGFRIIDGRGDVHVVTRDDGDAFHALSPNLGLLGVVSTITFRCTEDFAVSGTEAVTTVEGCEADLLGDGGDGRPSLERFVRETEFSRLEWWPQRGAERVVTWQARRMPTPPGFVPDPYERFAGGPGPTQNLLALLFTIIGNLDDLDAARRKLEDDASELAEALGDLPVAQALGPIGGHLADFVAAAVAGGVDAALRVLKLGAPQIRRRLPEILPKLIAAAVPLDEDGPQRFTDHGWSGLPMDNAVDDELLRTEFTEAWVPLGRTQQVMRLLHEYFTSPDDDHEAWRRTGTYAWELYAAPPTPFWLHPAHSDGADEWRDGAFRIDPYWFADNAEDPCARFFMGLWRLLRDNDVPFRLHWGKFQPPASPGDDGWVRLLRRQYPRWDDFLALRAQRDPDNIFLTDYWRSRLGLWDAPTPVARS
jgi:hypothetical protein